MPAPTGLSEHEARELARAGKGNTAVSGSTRTTGRILRSTVFSFYNNTLFVIAFALLALGRYSDALVSVGLASSTPRWRRSRSCARNASSTVSSSWLASR